MQQDEYSIETRAALSNAMFLQTKLNEIFAGALKAAVRREISKAGLDEPDYTDTHSYDDAQRESDRDAERAERRADWLREERRGF